MRADGFRPASRADDATRRRYGRPLDAVAASIEEDERRRYGRPVAGAQPALEPVPSFAPRHVPVDRPALERVGGGGRLFGRAGAAFTAVALVTVVAVVALAGAGFFEHLSPTPSPPPLVSFPGRVSWMQRLDARQGVVLAGRNLYTTRDAGRSWRGGPLPVVSLGSASVAAASDSSASPDPFADDLAVPYGISFVDADHGWLAMAPRGGLGGPLFRGGFADPTSTAGGPTPDFATAVYATSDGGRTWRALTNPGVAGASLALQFVDRQHGWLLAASPDGTVVSLRTTDGGRTWTRLDTPESAGPWFRPTYTSASEGWMIEVVDALRFRVYHTAGAGSTWSPSLVEVPATPGAEQIQMMGTAVSSGGVARVTLLTGVVTAGDSESGAVTQPADRPGSYRVYTFRSDDAGSTWQIDRSADVPSVADLGVGSQQSQAELPGAFGLGVLVGSGAATIPYVTPGSGAGSVRASFDWGATWRTYDTTILPGPVIDASWASPDDVWAMVPVADGPWTAIYASSDGGTTWRPLLAAPPLAPVPSGAPTASPAMESTFTGLPEMPAPSPVAPTLRFGVAAADQVWEQRADSFSWYQRTADGGSWAGGSLPFVPDSVDATGPDQYAVARQADEYGDVAGGVVANVDVAVSSGPAMNASRLQVPVGEVSTRVAVTVHIPAWPRVSVFVDQVSDPLPHCLRFDSRDGGGTWSAATPTPCVKGRTFTSRTAGYGLADLRDTHSWAIATTADGGATWRISEAYPPFDSGEAASVAFVDTGGTTGTMYAAVSTFGAAHMEIVKSTDGGKTWAMDSAARATRATVLGPGHWLAFTTPDLLPSSPLTAHETKDAGRTWKEVAVVGLPSFTSMQWANGTTGYATGPALAGGCLPNAGDPPSTCWANWETLYWTSDAGRTWTDVGGSSGP